MQIAITQMLGLIIASLSRRSWPESSEVHQAFGEERTIRTLLTERNAATTQHIERRHAAPCQIGANQQMQWINTERRNLANVGIRIAGKATEHQTQIEIAFVDSRADRLRIRAAYAFEADPFVIHLVADVLGHPRAQWADLTAADPQMDRRAAEVAHVVDPGQGHER